MEHTWNVKGGGRCANPVYEGLEVCCSGRECRVCRQARSACGLVAPAWHPSASNASSTRQYTTVPYTQTPLRLVGSRAGRAGDERVGCGCIAAISCHEANFFRSRCLSPPPLGASQPRPACPHMQVFRRTAVAGTCRSELFSLAGCTCQRRWCAHFRHVRVCLNACARMHACMYACLGLLVSTGTCATRACLLQYILLLHSVAAADPVMCHGELMYLTSG